MRKSGLFYPILLLACWTGLVLAGTFAVAETTLRQHLAKSFAVTHGKIVFSQVGHGVIMKRGVEIAYNYVVNGVEYTGHRYRYDDHNAALQWDATVKQHPRWSFENIYYNPNDPADSVLQPGVDGSDLLLLLFALPLNVMTATLWRAMFTQIRDRYRTLPAGGVRILKQPGETRVALGDTSPVAAGFYGMAATAFVASFPVVVTSGFQPSVHLMKGTWIMVLIGGAVIFVWRWFKKLSGTYDLRINQTAQTVTLPQAGGRPQPLSIARVEISGVSMQRRVTRSPSGTHFSYLPALQCSGVRTDNDSLKLVNWGWSEEKARSFGQWLSQELGVEFRGVEEEKSELAAKTS